MLVFFVNYAIETKYSQRFIPLDTPISLIMRRILINPNTLIHSH